MFRGGGRSGAAFFRLLLVGAASSLLPVSRVAVLSPGWWCCLSPAPPLGGPSFGRSAAGPFLSFGVVLLSSCGVVSPPPRPMHQTSDVKWRRAWLVPGLGTACKTSKFCQHQLFHPLGVAPSSTVGPDWPGSARSGPPQRARRTPLSTGCDPDPPTGARLNELGVKTTPQKTLFRDVKHGKIWDTD